MVEEQKAPFVFAKKPMFAPAPSGKKITVSTNYYPIKLKTSNMIFVYSVKFEPEIPPENIRFRKKVVRSVQDQLDKHMSKSIFTGSNLFTPTDLGMAPVRILTAIDDIKYTIELLIAHRIALSDVLNPHKDPSKAQTANMFFNLIIKKLLSACKMYPMGRTGKYLMTNEGKTIPDFGIEVFPGFKTSVKLCDSGLLLEVDYTSRIVRKQTALDRLIEIRRWGGNFIAAAKEDFLDRSVMATYGTRRNYVISDVIFELDPIKYQFETREGTINMMDYMKKKYNIQLKDPKQPLLLSIKKQRDKTEEKVYLAPEVCTLTGLPDGMREDFRAMKQVALYTKLSPDQRSFEMKRLLKKFNEMSIDNKPKPGEALDQRPTEQPGQIIKDWGIEIAQDPASIEAFILPPVTVRLGGKKDLVVPTSGQFNLRQPILNPLGLDKWILIHTGKDKGVVDTFVDTLYNASQTFGIKVDYPQYFESHNTRASDFISAAEKAMEQFPDPQIIVFVLPPPSKSEYGKIKKWAVGKPVLTQCVVTRTLQNSKGLMAICSKIVLQMNSKRNGDLWWMKIPEGIPKKTMVIGVDVSREGRNTFLGMASSYDPNFTKYYTQIKKLDSKQEICSSVGIFVVNGLARFKQETKSFLPDLLIIYRDGVGDSQKGDLVAQELVNIRTAIKSQIPDYAPKILFATVNKKIHTRFFEENGGFSGGRGGRGGRGYGGEEGNLKNPTPGTVVHNGIIDSKLYEFFIMPQYVNEGTGTPSRIHVLYDDTGIPFNKFEELTNVLCYGYDNWQGAIRTPAPCKYALTHAKLAAKHTGCVPERMLLSYKYFL